MAFKYYLSMILFVFGAEAYAAPMVDPVEFECDIAGKGNRKIAFKCHTNLPEQTLLWMRVESSTPGVYFGGGEATVEKGEVAFGPFTKQGAALPMGKYKALFYMDVKQPPSVVEAVGKNGEHLSGPHVHKGWGKNFLFETFFSLGGADAEAAENQNAAKHKKEVQEIYQELKRLAALAPQFRKGALTNDPLEKRDCIQNLRATHPLVETVRDRTMKLDPLNYGNLRYAATAMFHCTNCSESSALEMCPKALDALEKARENIPR